MVKGKCLGGKLLLSKNDKSMRAITQIEKSIAETNLVFEAKMTKKRIVSAVL